MNHDPSRKQFFAKLIGLIVATSLAPKLLLPAQRRPEAPASPAQPFALRPETRAVARGESVV